MEIRAPKRRNALNAISVRNVKSHHSLLSFLVTEMHSTSWRENNRFIVGVSSHGEKLEGLRGEGLNSVCTWPKV